MPVAGRVLLPLAFAISTACDPAMSIQRAPCELYRPHIAKRTFDGRVGAVLIRNAGARPMQVQVFHPDGLGDPFQTWTVAPNVLQPLTDPDGQRLPLGNDWGIKVERSCVRTLGQAAEWNPGEFSLHWDGDSLRAGLGRGH
jgi:hypothetical protein